MLHPGVEICLLCVHQAVCDKGLGLGIGLQLVGVCRRFVLNFFQFASCLILYDSHIPSSWFEWVDLRHGSIVLILVSRTISSLIFIAATSTTHLCKLIKINEVKSSLRIQRRNHPQIARLQRENKPRTPRLRRD